MKMDDMNVYLENRGFNVERTYIKDAREYDFAISLPGQPTMHGRFKYPETTEFMSPQRQKLFVDDAQIKFLNNLMGSYKRYFGCLGQAPDPEFVKYAREDVETTMGIYNKMSFTIKNVIFNYPATIVFWMDGTKTVVKCQEYDFYDPEKGLAMAIAKKALGNQGNYYNEIHKWVGKCEDQNDEAAESYINEFFDRLRKELLR